MASRVHEPGRGVSAGPASGGVLGGGARHRVPIVSIGCRPGREAVRVIRLSDHEAVRSPDSDEKGCSPEGLGFFGLGQPGPEGLSGGPGVLAYGLRFQAEFLGGLNGGHLE